MSKLRPQNSAGQTSEPNDPMGIVKWVYLAMGLALLVAGWIRCDPSILMAIGYLVVAHCYSRAYR
jgi:hypothetical protein